MNNGTGKSNFTKLGGFGVLSIAVLGLGLIGCGSTAPVIQDSSVVEGSEKMTPVEHDSDSPRDDGQPRRHSGGVSGNNYQAGVSLLQDGKLEEARRVLELAGEEMPDRIEIRNALGALYRRLGRTEQAVSEYRKGLELAKDSPQTKESGEAASQLHNNLGIALREMGDFGGAEAEYQEAIRLNSRLP
ncbi:MAG TPA: tetratricopeptide repeat protein, partial [Nitrospiria bacterium]|nr:tetratricopeptide repeat protein [Nitrospiria bacterium]